MRKISEEDVVEELITERSWKRKRKSPMNSESALERNAKVVGAV
jgi:hypothetical protein